MTAGSTDATTWGRVADDGTVFVRTSEGGERAVGSWHAGAPAEGLAHFARRYDDLATEVALIETRMKRGAGRPAEAVTQLTRIKESLPTAAVVGDLAGLDARIDEVVALAAAKVDEARAARREAGEKVNAARLVFVEEAERISASGEWKKTGDRYRAIVEEWKLLRGGDRATETALWQRLSSARSSFDQRRKAHFAELEATRGKSAERKEQLIREAESLRESTEWVTTAKRYKELMSSWKAAGAAPKDVEQELWGRFRAAQDAFFARRAEHLATRDAATKEAIAAKTALLAEAEALEPQRDLPGAQARIRDIQDRWEKTERVPRELGNPLEDRLRAVEERIRDLGDSQRQQTRAAPANPFVEKLREAVAALEAKVAAGDQAAAAELATKREWLEQAEKSDRSARR